MYEVETVVPFRAGSATSRDKPGAVEPCSIPGHEKGRKDPHVKAQSTD